MTTPGAASAPRRRLTESYPVPSRAFAPVVGSVVAIAAWAAVAHNSGAGWVQALGALLAAFLVIGLCAPALAVRRARCHIVSGPFDATVGAPTSLVVSVNAAVRLRSLHPPGPVLLTGRRTNRTLTLVPHQRGVMGRCEIELASAAPFGLLWWTKRLVLGLPRPIAVAPPVGPTNEGDLTPGNFEGVDARRIDARVGEPRGVRAYRAGDLRHWVHWPATAHTGSLMVREMESPAAQPVVVTALLPDDPEAADALAGRALGTVEALLWSGRAVVLVTAEPTGLVEAPVENLGDAGRRLARALPQPAFTPTTRAGRRAARKAAES